MKNTKLIPIVECIADKNYPGARAAIDSALIGETGVHWILYLNRLRDFLIDGIPRATIIMEKGNGKLPFMAFSSLPGKRFCPGAGDCLKFCFSFKAWRYPGAFIRQCQNTVLLDSARGRNLIEQAVLKIIIKPKYIDGIDFRIYVDGDYRNNKDISFWFNLLRANSKIRAYGYSKSFKQLLAYAKKGGTLPSNYVLNISSGHKHNLNIVAKIEQLSITRGHFMALDMHEIKPENGKLHTRAQIQRELIAQTGTKAFVCPGKCGDCVKLKGGKNLHFCGGDNSLPVVIAMH